jgi:hypothetical protein
MRGLGGERLGPLALVAQRERTSAHSFATGCQVTVVPPTPSLTATGASRVSRRLSWPILVTAAPCDRSAGGELQKLDRLEVLHPAADPLGGVEQHVGLGGIGVAQDADAEPVDDEIAAAEVAERDGVGIGAMSGMSSASLPGTRRGSPGRRLWLPAAR